jgi:enamine deaminase RidA (YjgF/YER057c/UK114 family)
MIERFGSGGAYESLVGYSRTVRAGEHVFVAGCTATGADGVVLGVGDAAAQAREALDACERGLDLAGARLADVVRTRVYLTDVTQWERVGRVHAERFGAEFPVTTMLAVAALLDPRLLVEIEVEAYLPR